MELEIIRPLFVQYGITDLIPKVLMYLLDDKVHHLFGRSETRLYEEVPHPTILSKNGLYFTVFNSQYITNETENYIIESIHRYVKDHAYLVINEKLQQCPINLIHKDSLFPITLYPFTVSLFYRRCNYIKSKLSIIERERSIWNLFNYICSHELVNDLDCTDVLQAIMNGINNYYYDMPATYSHNKTFEFFIFIVYKKNYIYNLLDGIGNT
jgi:hypothetical protein